MHTIIAAADTRQRLLLAAALVHGSPMDPNIIAATPVVSTPAQLDEDLAIVP